MIIYKLSAFGIIFYLLFWTYFLGAKLGIILQSEKAYKTSLKIAIISNIIIIIVGATWSGYTGSATQKWIGLSGFVVCTWLGYKNLKNLTPTNNK